MTRGHESDTLRETKTAAPQYTFAKTDRPVTCYCSCLWDEGSSPAFIKVCAYFPYPAKIWLNGHEWAKRQALRAGLRFTELSCTKHCNRLLRPLLAADQPQAPSELRTALHAIDHYIDDYITRARLGRAA